MPARFGRRSATRLHTAWARRLTPASTPAARRGAFTLVEMLVAMVLTLILVAAIAEFYARVGDAVKDGRAMIEMSTNLRTVVQRLKSDLELITLPVAPWTDDGGYFAIWEGNASDADVNGNFLIDNTDAAWTTDTNLDGVFDFENSGVTTLLGDGDDALGMTIRASGEALTGRYAGSLVSGQHAEVVWWVGFDNLDNDSPPVWDLDEPRQIYRRQLLIRPDYGQLNATDFPFTETGWNAAKLWLTGTFWQSNDISASIRLANDGTNPVFRIFANSLADLSRRERRFGNWLNDYRVRANTQTWGENFPYPTAATPTGNVATQGTPLLPCASAKSTIPSPFVQQGLSRGEDIVLTNILAMDVRVYDPSVALRADVHQAELDEAVSALAPGDPGFLEAITDATMHPQIGTGAYVDLGYGTSLVRVLLLPPYSLPVGTAQTTATTGLPGPNYFAAHSSEYNIYSGATLYILNGNFYDTWSLAYERDGLNQDWQQDGVADIYTGPSFDEGFNGLDDDNLYGVDDIAERETVPPFARPLRGVQVRIRVYEPSTRQMRQATVATDFILE